MADPIKVLFVCTGNSCRSQMAEGFTRHYGRGVIEPYSAGTHPTALHPVTVDVMAERGIDISGHRSKGIADVPQDVEVVVTVCDQAAEECPLFPGAHTMLHWSLPDPAKATGTPEEVKATFRAVRDDIEARVRSLVRQLRRP
jgi:arsenate reductase